MIETAIKDRETYILEKNSMEIDTDIRIAQAIESSSMLSSKDHILLIYLAGKGRIHLLLRDIEEEKSMKGLKNINERQKRLIEN